MIRGHDDTPEPTTAVTISRGAVGAHIGIRYATSDGSRHLHLAFHHDLRDEGWADADAQWIAPGFSDPLGMVRTLAALVGNLYRDGQVPVPYALRPANAAFNSSTGTILLNDSIGLTCSTFVLRLFASAHVSLVDEPSWDTGRSPSRVEEDNAAQRQLVEYLRKSYKQHADAVESEIGCTRIRAEEVAAASNSQNPPVKFEDVQRAASQLLAQLPA